MILDRSDFTFTTVKLLIKTLLSEGYTAGTLAGQVNETYKKKIMFRHDVDAKENNSLKMAVIQNKNRITGTYYFREFKFIRNLDVINKIASLSHEIGYHYEDLVRNRGNYSKAISDFEYNLDRLRKYYPVTTICADGNPWSRWNNLWLWDKYDYKRFGIECEVYLDIDYNVFAYYTDTGRCWDGHRYNVWDKVKTQQSWPTYHNTFDIIQAIKNNKFPPKVVINFHPQRWTDQTLPWFRELLIQNTKNIVKQAIVMARKKSYTRGK
jgi:hypothetical protein